MLCFCFKLGSHNYVKCYYRNIQLMDGYNTFGIVLYTSCKNIQLLTL